MFPQYRGHRRTRRLRSLDMGAGLAVRRARSARKPSVCTSDLRLVPDHSKAHRQRIHNRACGGAVLPVVPLPLAAEARLPLRSASSRSSVRATLAAQAGRLLIDAFGGRVEKRLSGQKFFFVVFPVHNKLTHSIILEVIILST